MEINKQSQTAKYAERKDLVKNQQGKPGEKHEQPNIPGPQELPDQQKVGEDNDGQHTPNPQHDRQENEGKKAPDENTRQ